MSAVPKLSRDKDGFLKCRDCPRRFLTELMFENHSCNKQKNLKIHINSIHKNLNPHQYQD